VLLAGIGSDLTRRGDGYGRAGITFKGVIGTELAARGLNVRLGVYEDQRNYDVTAEREERHERGAGPGALRQRRRVAGGTHRVMDTIGLPR
jgi:hypothetical protein